MKTATNSPGINETPIRVLIAEAQPATRDLLAGVIRSDARTELASVATDGRAAIRDSASADAAVLDARLPQLDGLSALSHIHDRQPDKPVIVLLPTEVPYLRAEAQRRGATAVITYARAADELIPAILNRVAERRPS